MWTSHPGRWTKTATHGGSSRVADFRAWAERRGAFGANLSDYMPSRIETAERMLEVAGVGPESAGAVHDVDAAAGRVGPVEARRHGARRSAVLPRPVLRTGPGGGLQDSAKAVRWFRLAAEQGQGNAQNALGWMYARGEGVPQDLAEAARWFSRYGGGGLVTLGNIYRDGRIVLQDLAEAAGWYRRAAEQGEVEAQFNLGRMYSRGEGVPQDEAEAARWFRLVANQRDQVVAFRAASYFESGADALRNDDAEGAEWSFRRAAELGHAGAHTSLGWMYSRGEGVPQDYTEAAWWLRLAADQGVAVAQYELGRAYVLGQGVPQDDVEAARSFRRAGRQRPSSDDYGHWRGRA